MPCAATRRREAGIAGILVLPHPITLIIQDQYDAVRASAAEIFQDAYDTTPQARCSMMFRVGSAIIAPDEDRPQRVTRLANHHGTENACYQAVLGDKAEKRPVPVASPRQGSMPPARFAF